MFNRKSSYALNKKDPNAIVYMDANEAIIRLTREDFASEKEEHMRDLRKPHINYVNHAENPFLIRDSSKKLFICQER